MPASETVLITGAAQPIGRMLALDFAACRWRVALQHAAPDAADARRLADEIAARGGSAAVLATDVADVAALARLIPDCAAALGLPTCLVNAAALAAGADLRAPVVLAQSFAAHLPANAHGNIVNIIAPWTPTPRFSAAALAAADLWSATRMLALTLAPRIRVNAVALGGAEIGPHGAERDIAAAVGFILDAPAMTGQMIALDLVPAGAERNP